MSLQADFQFGTHYKQRTNLHNGGFSDFTELWRLSGNRLLKEIVEGETAAGIFRKRRAAAVGRCAVWAGGIEFDSAIVATTASRSGFPDWWN
jgi:hypothetical protein